MAYEYTPGIAYDPETGAEVPDFGNGVLEGSEYRESINQYYAQNPEAGYYTDEYGNVHHEYENGYDEEADYIEQVESEYDSLPITDADAADLRSIAGGDAQYVALCQWASENISQEASDYFDALMESGNYEAIADVIEELLEYARSQGFDPSLLEFDEDYDDYEDDEYDDSDEVDLVEANPHPVGSNEAVGAWCALNLPEHWVAEIDHIFEYGSPREQQAAMHKMREIYEDAYAAANTY